MSVITSSQIREIVQSVLQVYESANDVEREEMEPILQELVERLSSQVGTIELSENPQSKELWNLARGNANAFAQYLSNYSDPIYNDLSVSQIQQMIKRLGIESPVAPTEPQDGIPPAPLKSSNVFGFRYNPQKKRLTVRFNSGSVYRYSGVPKVVFDLFSVGARKARTHGKNQFGKWWVGKTPSLGAAFDQLIKSMGYTYQRVK